MVLALSHMAVDLDRTKREGGGMAEKANWSREAYTGRWSETVTTGATLVGEKKLTNDGET